MISFILLSLFLFLALLCVIEIFFVNKKDSSLLLFLYLSLIFFLCLLKPIGATNDDVFYYYHLKGVGDDYGFEIGYAYFVDIYKLLNLNDYGFFTATVVTICLFVKIMAYFNASPYVVVPIFIYCSHFFWYQEITQIRSALASSFAFLALFLSIKNKKFFSFITFLLAISFHKALLLFFPAFFIHRVKVKKKYFTLALLFTAAAIFSGVINSLIGFLASFVLPQNVVATYFSSESVFSKGIGLLNPATIKYVLFSFVFVGFSKKVKSCTYDSLVNLYVFGTAWIILFSSFATLAARVAFFFTIFEMIIVPMLLFSIRRVSNKVVCFSLFFLCYLVIFVVNIFFKGVISF